MVSRGSKLMLWIVAGFLLGMGGGIALSEWASPAVIERVVSCASPFGGALVAMLKMAVIPIIFFSLIVGAASLPLKHSGRIGGMVVGWYAATSLVATLIGVGVAYLMNPTIAEAGELATGNLAAVTAVTGDVRGISFSEYVVGLFCNPFEALAEGKFLPVIVFAVFTGLCARFILDRASPDTDESRTVKMFIDVCDGIQRVAFRMIDCVMFYFPIGVFALSLTNFAAHGLLLFGPYVRIVACVVTGVAVMLGVVYPLLLAVFARVNPFRVLWRLRNPFLTAFITRSSIATLPISYQAADELGVKRTLSSFSLPMGATVNMDGVCVHLPAFVILAANLFGHPLSFFQIVALCVSVMVASVGAGGIPGGSIFLLFMVLEAMGLPGEEVSMVVALAIGINPVLDMFETSCNVIGDNVCTYIVAKSGGELTEK